MVRISRDRLHAAAQATAVGAVVVYRWLISPLLAATAGPACRFDPTCSEYAHQALTVHGLGRGLYLTLRRLLRCRPMGGWGYDPVPANRSQTPHHP
jgi:putative membrane protein insertion efficiency factor